MPELDDARQIRMDRYGGPDVLTWSRAAVPEPSPGEVRLRVLAAGVNHTDLKIRAGLWPIRRPGAFPYVPGVEAVGRVEAIGPGVRDLRLGDTVITMMQGMGGVRAERDGGYATHVLARAETVAAVPPEVDPLAMAALGLPGVTAWEGLARLGDLRGRRLLVTGAAGGVGSAAVAIGAMAGACVTALVARPAQADYVERLGASAVIVSPPDRPPVVPPESQDGVLDTVGGPVFGPCVEALAPGGALCLVGAVGGGAVAFDAWALIRPTRLTGYSTEDLTGDALRAAIAGLAAGLAKGALRPPRFETVPLEQAAEAHRRLEAGGVSGRLLLVPEAPTTSV
jgi:NADPH2:quinone reductase